MRCLCLGYAEVQDEVAEPAEPQDLAWFGFGRQHRWVSVADRDSKISKITHGHSTWNTTIWSGGWHACTTAKKKKKKVRQSIIISLAWVVLKNYSFLANLHTSNAKRFKDMETEIEEIWRPDSWWHMRSQKKEACGTQWYPVAQAPWSSSKLGENGERGSCPKNYCTSLGLNCSYDSMTHKYS